MMTLTEVFPGMAPDTTDFMEKSPEEAMCDVVRSAITDAARSGRLTHGISECVTALRRDPKEVVICILPLDTSHCDVNLNIQLLLVESVCVEYDILVLKLDISELDSGLAFTGGSKAELMIDNGALDGSKPNQPMKSALLKACPELGSDLFCCLIQHGEEGPSFNDRKLLNTFQGLAEEEEYSYSYNNNITFNNNNKNNVSSHKRHNSSSCSMSEESSEEFPPE